MSNQPLISVIIPVYNVEKYLPRCLDSVCNQTYPNLEIILVDDGSTDNSLKICQAYAQKDKRITVIHQQNGGLPVARNTGMDHMHGDFFTFIDSDDWIAPDYCEVLLHLIRQSGADVSAGNLTYVYENGAHVPFKAPPASQTLFTGKDILLFGLNYHHYACLKLYRTATCATLRFDPYYSYCEDVEFFFRLTKKIHSLVYCPKELLFYYQHANSAIHTLSVLAREKAFEIWKKTYDSSLSAPLATITPLLLDRAIGAASTLTMTVILQDRQHQFSTLLQQTRQWLLQHSSALWRVQTMGFPGKLFIYLFLKAPKTIVFCCRIPGIRPLLRKIFIKRITSQL